MLRCHRLLKELPVWPVAQQPLRQSSLRQGPFRATSRRRVIWAGEDDALTCLVQALEARSIGLMPVPSSTRRDNHCRHVSFLMMTRNRQAPPVLIGPPFFLGPGAASVRRLGKSEMRGIRGDSLGCSSQT